MLDIKIKIQLLAREATPLRPSNDLLVNLQLSMKVMVGNGAWMLTVYLLKGSSSTCVSVDYRLESKLNLVKAH